ncbi:hypothetical protein P167DRAFT_576011 [Morchella conica CCBAS932]|uniref:Uncharacterized protein n=1 Tax=Morchella conica CCBAS932 TaxID=1392247 RepID=A0A3N4KJF7_9PEZI|nr:hypothetical protein P167DRAFT_576011 [Morchella conica CCBAS932]
MVSSNIKHEPQSPPLDILGDTTHPKRKAQTELNPTNPVPFDSSSDSDEPLTKKYLRKLSTTDQSLSGSEKGATASTTKKIENDSITPRVRRSVARRQRKPSPSSESGDKLGVARDAHSYSLLQPAKATNSPGAGGYTLPVSSASNNGVGEELPKRTLRPRTKSVEYRFLYPGDKPPAPRNPIAGARASSRKTDGPARAMPSPDRGSTGSTSTVVVRRCVADAVTKPSPSPPPEPAAAAIMADVETNTSPPPPEPAVAAIPGRTMVDTAVNTGLFTVIYVDGYPFIVPADPVECFSKIQSQVISSYNAVIAGEGTAWEKSVGSTGCVVSEFASGGEGNVVSKMEGGWGAGSADGNGGESTEEDEDYGTPKD